jgi:Glycosyl hydrolase family 76
VSDDVLDAWRALERASFRRTRFRRRLRVTDEQGRRAPVALWGLVHVLWAANDLRALGEDVPIDELTGLVDGYRWGDGYAAKPRTRRRFYDDNAWLGLVALGLGDRARARRILEFVRTGDDPTGGVRWVEGGSTRNTCSTASAAWLAALLGEMDAAGRWMDWLDATLRGDGDLYLDRIDGGTIDPNVFSYNQGAAVGARHALGRDRSAVATALASLAVFDGERLWREPPPFVAIWFRALLGVPAVADQARDRLEAYAARLLDDARDPATGSFTRGGVGTYDGTHTIDQAAVVQVLAMREIR